MDGDVLQTASIDVLCYVMNDVGIERTLEKMAKETIFRDDSKRTKLKWMSF